jgi:hypothetical protein
VVLFNLNLTAAAPITLDLGEVTGSITRYQIAPTSLHDDNEDAEKVTIGSDTPEPGTPLQVELPVHSLTALEWTRSP